MALAVQNKRCITETLYLGDRHRWSPTIASTIPPRDGVTSVNRGNPYSARVLTSGGDWTSGEVRAVISWVGTLKQLKVRGPLYTSADR